jgi:hypothetical protein
MLLICPVRPGDTNEELRYALRSWETNLHLLAPWSWELGGGQSLTLMTVGDCPSWLSPDHHVPGNLHSSLAFNVFDNVLLGAQEAVTWDEEECLYMNDDFFCLDPVGAVLPVKRNISLADHIARVGAGSSTWWGQSLRLTASWLAEVGFPHPDSYDAASIRQRFQKPSRWER